MRGVPYLRLLGMVLWGTTVALTWFLTRTIGAWSLLFWGLAGLFYYSVVAKMLGFEARCAQAEEGEACRLDLVRSWVIIMLFLLSYSLGGVFRALSTPFMPR